MFWGCAVTFITVLVLVLVLYLDWLLRCSLAQFLFYIFIKSYFKFQTEIKREELFFSKQQTFCTALDVHQLNETHWKSNRCAGVDYSVTLNLYPMIIQPYFTWIGIYAPPPTTYRKFSPDVLIRGGFNYTLNSSFVITEHLKWVSVQTNFPTAHGMLPKSAG